MALSCPTRSAVDTNNDGVKDTLTSVAVGTPLCFAVRFIIPPTTP